MRLGVIFVIAYKPVETSAVHRLSPESTAELPNLPDNLHEPRKRLLRGLQRVAARPIVSLERHRP